MLCLAFKREIWEAATGEILHLCHPLIRYSYVFLSLRCFVSTNPVSSVLDVARRIFAGNESLRPCKQSPGRSSFSLASSKC